MKRNGGLVEISAIRSEAVSAITALALCFESGDRVAIETLASVSARHPRPTKFRNQIRVASCGLVRSIWASAKTKEVSYDLAGPRPFELCAVTSPRPPPQELSKPS
jgi:hypothetical protein